jgi:hypothetical protein
MKDAMTDPTNRIEITEANSTVAARVISRRIALQLGKPLAFAFIGVTEVWTPFPSGLSNGYSAGGTLTSGDISIQ